MPAQIKPVRVHGLDQIGLPRARPAFYGLFPGYCIKSGRMLLIPDQPFEGIASGEPRSVARSMFMEPSAQIVRHTSVKRAALARCQDVNPIALLHVLIGNGMDPMVKPWDDGGVSKKDYSFSAPSRPLSRNQNRTDRSRIKSGMAIPIKPGKILSTPLPPARILLPCLFNGLSGGPSFGKERAGRGWEAV